MSESAEALAANLKSRRNVTIEITNITNDFCMVDPKVHLESGNCHSPAQPTVMPMRTEVCNFSKGSGKASGAVGLLAYDLHERHKGISEKMVIMFSVPFDQNFYKNWFALGIFDKDTEINSALFNKMYNDKEPSGFVRQESNGCGLTYEGRSLDIMGTMSPMGKAIMKVEVWNKIFSVKKGW